MNPDAPDDYAAERNGYLISTDPTRLDLVAVHAYLARSYWAAGIPFEVVRRAAEHSFCFGVYHGGEQIGFARVITDRATFGYLADVYVLQEHRGMGIGKWLVETVLAHPDLQGLRRFMLVTRDAAGLYTRYGFQPPEEPSGILQIRKPNPYQPVRPASTADAEHPSA